MKRSLMISVLLLGAFACQRAEPTALLNDVSANDIVSDDVSAPIGVSDEASTDHVMAQIARSFATAMADEEVRLDVRDAMRRSPWGQHVVDLSQFLQSSGGATASSRMSAVRGESVEQLHSSVVGLLQPLDLYIPSGVMRRTWSGSADIGVYASLDFEDGAVFGYDTDGRTLTYQPGTHEAHFLIGPALRRTERYDIDAGDSTFVEGPNEIAMYYSWSDADGNVIEEHTYADLVREGRIPGAGGPQMAPSNGDTRVWS